jgi:EAL domain-containing protein (putative c-di-GMP-specific phosphodiesterase class I)
LNTPLRLGEHEVFVTASIGIAMSSLGYTHPHDLLRDADIAMHRAKSNGKACYQVFDTLMHSHAMELLRLETDLRRTLERQEYRIHYQPVIALGTGKIVGFEALLRWQHPERGLVLPGEFISIAEETGLIVSIDRWVMREACQQASRWRHYYNGPDGAPLSISVNLSAKQFTHSNLVEELTDILRETDLPPGCLNLEITESLLISNSEPVKALLSRLKAMGLELHLDDFGTGYSSLSYLHRFPIDVLKIDRSFVSRIENNGENSEIPDAIITMAHHLGMKVIAEGVETSSQLAHLKQLGCEYGQGNYFSPAVDVVMAEKLLQGASLPRG